MVNMRSLLHRALTAAGRRPKLRFLLTCPPDSTLCLADMLAGLRSRLPGCSLDCRGIEEAGLCASRYDAVFVVLDKAEQTLSEQLVTSLRCEKWRYHLLLDAARRPAITGVAHRQFVDRGHLQSQLNDLMFERARDVQRIPRSSNRRPQRS